MSISVFSNVIVSEQWEIELIRSHYPPDVRSGEGKAFYRVLWRLAPGAEESWEEEENWVHEDDMSCPELIKAYWSEYQDKCRTSGVVLDNPPASVKRKYTSRTPSLASAIKSKKKQPTSAKKKKTAFVERKKQDSVEKKTSASVVTTQAEKEKRRTPTSRIRKRSWLQTDESGNESDIAEETQDKQLHTPVSKSILFDVTSSPSAASKEKDSLMIGEIEALRQQQQKNEELRRQIAELEKSSIDDMQLPLEQIDDGMEKLEKSSPKEVSNKQSVRSVQKTLLHEVLTKKTPSGGRPHKRPRTSDVASPLDETLRFIRAIKEDASPASPSTTFSKLSLEGNTPGANKKGPPRAKKNKPTSPSKTAETEKANKEKDAVMAVISEETDEGDAEEVAGGPVEPNALKEILTEELVNLLNLKQYAGIMDLLKRFAKECWNRNQDALKTLKPVYVLAFLPSLDGEPEQDWSVTIFENIPGQMPNHICQCVPTEQLFSKYPAVVIEAEQRFYTVV